MSIELIIFFILAALLIASSLSVIFQRNPVHSALSLVAALFFVAILFLTLKAPMLATLQILVYAGAIMVIFLFVIMLLNPEDREKNRLLRWSLGSVAASLLFLELIALFLPMEGKGAAMGRPVAADFGSPKGLAESLFTNFVLHFEIASILLLVALIGTVVLAKREH